MIKNFVAKLLRTPKFKQRKVESKKKYKRKKKVFTTISGEANILFKPNPYWSA